MITLNRFERSQKIVEAEKTLRLKFKPTKCKIIFLGDITEKRQSTFFASFENFCPVVLGFHPHHY